MLKVSEINGGLTNYTQLEMKLRTNQSMINTLNDRLSFLQAEAEEKEKRLKEQLDSLPPVANVDPFLRQMERFVTSIDPSLNQTVANGGLIGTVPPGIGLNFVNEVVGSRIEFSRSGIVVRFVSTTVIPPGTLVGQTGQLEAGTIVPNDQVDVANRVIRGSLVGVRIDNQQFYIAGSDILLPPNATINGDQVEVFNDGVERTAVLRSSGEIINPVYVFEGTTSRVQPQSAVNNSDQDNLFVEVYDIASRRVVVQRDRAGNPINPLSDASGNPVTIIQVAVSIASVTTVDVEEDQVAGRISNVESTVASLFREPGNSRGVIDRNRFRRFIKRQSPDPETDAALIVGSLSFVPSFDDSALVNSLNVRLAASLLNREQTIYVENLQKLITIIDLRNLIRVPASERLIDELVEWHQNPNQEDAIIAEREYLLQELNYARATAAALLPDVQADKETRAVLENVRSVLKRRIKEARKQEPKDVPIQVRKGETLSMKVQIDVETQEPTARLFIKADVYDTPMSEYLRKQAAAIAPVTEADEIRNLFEARSLALEDLEQAETEFQRASAVREPLKQRVDSARQRFFNIDERVDQASASVAELTALQVELTNEIPDLEDELNRLNANVANAEADVASKRTEFQNASSSGADEDVVNLSEAELNQARDVLERLTEQKDRKQAELDDARAQLQDVERKRNSEEVRRDGILARLTSIILALQTAENQLSGRNVDSATGKRDGAPTDASPEGQYLSALRAQAAARSTFTSAETALNLTRFDFWDIKANVLAHYQYLRDSTPTYNLYVNGRLLRTIQTGREYSIPSNASSVELRKTAGSEDTGPFSIYLRVEEPSNTASTVETDSMILYANVHVYETCSRCFEKVVALDQTKFGMCKFIVGKTQYENKQGLKTLSSGRRKSKFRGWHCASYLILSPPSFLTPSKRPDELIGYNYGFMDHEDEYTALELERFQKGQAIGLGAQLPLIIPLAAEDFQFFDPEDPAISEYIRRDLIELSTFPEPNTDIDFITDTLILDPEDDVPYENIGMSVLLDSEDDEPISTLIHLESKVKQKENVEEPPALKEVEIKEPVPEQPVQASIPAPKAVEFKEPVVEEKPEFMKKFEQAVNMPLLPVPRTKNGKISMGKDTQQWIKQLAAFEKYLGELDTEMRNNLK